MYGYRQLKFKTCEPHSNLHEMQTKYWQGSIDHFSPRSLLHHQLISPVTVRRSLRRPYVGRWYIQVIGCNFAKTPSRRLPKVWDASSAGGTLRWLLVLTEHNASNSYYFNISMRITGSYSSYCRRRGIVQYVRKMVVYNFFNADFTPWFKIDFSYVVNFITV